MDPEPQISASGYKKLPLWAWVIVYLVMGGAVYASLSYFYIAKKGTSPYAPPPPAATESTSQTTPASPGGTMDGDKATAPVSGTTDVAITPTGYEPQNITIKAGARVVWTNNSPIVATVNSAVHPTHEVYPPLNLGEVAPSQSVSLIFDTPGTYKYHNHLIPSQFGSVTVQ